MMKKPQVSDLQAKELPTPGSGGRCPADTGARGIDIASHQLGVAQVWARRGIPVVPCSSKDKGALVPGFGKDRSPAELARFSDLDQVTAWWSGRFKRAHVGLLTRRLVVIDLDLAKAGTPPLTGPWAGCVHGTDVLEQLLREAGAKWPETYTVVTPSGGLHLYFTQPEGEPIGCATGEGTTAPHLGPLIDVRGVGGYVIAAGSYSATQGRPYERISPAALGPQPVPAWLLEKLRPAAPAVPVQQPRPARILVKAGTRAERYAQSALRGEVDGVAQAPAGERNGRLFAAARRLGELSGTAPAVLAEGAVRDELLHAAQTAGLRGGDREALATIRSGWVRGCETQVSAA